MIILGLAVARHVYSDHACHIAIKKPKKYTKQGLTFLHYPKKTNKIFIQVRIK